MTRSTIAVILLCIANVAMAATLAQRGSWTMRLSKDGYYFEKREYQKEEISVSVVVAKDRFEWKAYVRDKVGAFAEPSKLGAFAALRAEDNECTIYIKDPDWVYEPEYIGHELAHCVFGDWHPRQTKSKKFL